MRRTVLAVLALAGAVAGAAPITGTLPVKNGSSTTEKYSFDEKDKRVFVVDNFGVEFC